MRQSKFTETQILSMLKEAEAGRPVNEIWRRQNISSAAYYKRKATYGRLEASTSNDTRNWSAKTVRSNSYMLTLLGKHGAEGCDRKKRLRPPRGTSGCSTRSQPGSGFPR